MNEEVAEALSNQTQKWEWIAMERNYYGLGNDENEAYRSLYAQAGMVGADQVQVGEFTAPVKVVVDMFGTVYWDDPAVVLEWRQDQ